MTWRYGLIKYKDLQGNIQYMVGEIFYAEDNKHISMCTEKPLELYESSRKDMIKVLEMMLKDVKKYPTYIPKASNIPTGEMKTTVCPHWFCNSFICDYEPTCWLIPCAKHGKMMVADTKLRALIRHWYYMFKLKKGKFLNGKK